VALTQQERVSTLEQAVEAGRSYGWNVVLKAAAPHLQDRPDLAHVWRNIGDEDDMRNAWETLTGMAETPDGAEFVVQPMSHAGIPVAICTLEDPLFGPIVSFGMAGTASELLGDIAYRIPPLTDSDAADLVRDVKAAPLFFGYRGSEAVDVAALEELILRVSRLKDDLPEVQALDLGLVLVGVDGADVLRATGRVTPVNYVRSDWYTRRLGGPSGTEDTLVS
jgi:acyl-CoA synthetase (NDP forming)